MIGSLAEPATSRRNVAFSRAERHPGAFTLLGRRMRTRMLPRVARCRRNVRLRRVKRRCRAERQWQLLRSESYFRRVTRLAGCVRPRTGTHNFFSGSISFSLSLFLSPPPRLSLSLPPPSRPFPSFSLARSLALTVLFPFPSFFFHFRGYFLLFSFLPTYLHSAVLSFRRLILRAAERALPSPRSNFERLRVALPCARASERAVYEDQDAPLVGLLYVFSIVGEERRRRRRWCRRLGE